MDVFLIEKDVPARGAAYGTHDLGHLLNVPAGQMSARPDEPGHFLRWINKESPAVGFEEGARADGNLFAPRHFYGRYIEFFLREAEAAAKGDVRLHHVKDEAVAVKRENGRVTVALKSGASIKAGAAVIALGNLPPRTPREPEGFSRLGRRYIANPWSGEALGSINRGDEVLLMGMGLTTVDVLISLAARGHVGPIRAFSRHGLIPQSHGPSSEIGSFPEAPTVRGILRWIREQGRAAGWRSAMDKLRPRVQDLWLSLNDSERRRFLRHARPYWDAHRHRIAPQLGRFLESLFESGRLRLSAGRLEKLEAAPEEGLRAVLRLRRGETETISAKWLVNCTGPEARPDKSGDPLIQSLLACGLARPDPLGLGFMTAENGAVIGTDGRAAADLYTIGSWRKGGLWESIAVPELRVQALELASLLTAPAVSERSSASALGIPA